MTTPAAAVALAAIYAVRQSFRPIATRFRRRWASAACGVSTAYVFVDILPELAARHTSLVATVGPGLRFASQRLYLVALIGFVVFYGLEYLVLGVRSETPGGSDRPAGDPACWLDLGGFALYNWLIGYLLGDREAVSSVSLGLYTVAMAFHLTVVDETMVRKHGLAYHRWGRWLLAAGLLAGWGMSAVVRVPEPWMSRLFAFIAGGVVMTSANAELPRGKEGRFAWFVLGAAAYAALLLSV
jgi:hypothetical protein